MTADSLNTMANVLLCQLFYWQRLQMCSNFVCLQQLCKDFSLLLSNSVSVWCVRTSPILKTSVLASYEDPQPPPSSENKRLHVRLCSKLPTFQQHNATAWTHVLPTGVISAHWTGIQPEQTVCTPIERTVCMPTEQTVCTPTSGTY